MAVYMEFPGVEFVEKDFDGGSRPISGVATDEAAIMILSQRGPINKPVRCTSEAQAFEVFGSYVDYAYGAYAIEGFFRNKGRVLWICRMAHYADITDPDTLMAKLATGALFNRRPYSDPEDAEISIGIDALSHGSDANRVGVKIVDAPVVLTGLDEAVVIGAEKFVLTSLRNIEVGQVLKLLDEQSEVSEPVIVAAIEFETFTVKLTKPITSAFPMGTIVTSCEFNLEVYYKTVVGVAKKETFNELNMIPGHKRYAMTIVNSDSTGSNYVRLTDYFSDEDPYYTLPEPTAEPVFLKGGDDGLKDFSDIDIMGSAIAKTGFHALNAVEGMLGICCPESDSREVIRAGFNYAQNRGNAIYVGYVPSGLNPQAAADFRDEAGWNTSYGALYYNWGRVTDPIGIGEAPKKLIPLSGHILGCWARNDREEGYGKSPAGEYMQVLGVDSLEFQVDRINGGVMYGNRDRNINPIVNLSGNGGIAIWGQRLQCSDNRWFNIMCRRIFIYVEESIVRGTRWAAFRNKNDRLYNNIVRVVGSFLSKVEGLAGATADERYAIVCNSTINDAKDPYVISRVGLNVEGVGEFIFFEIGQKPEGVKLDEI